MQVEHLMQIDLKGWGVGYVSAFQEHCLRLLQMLNSVSGLREYFSQTDERNAPPRIPVMVNMAFASVSAKKGLKLQEGAFHHRSHSLDRMTANKNSMMDEYSDEDEEFQIPDDKGGRYYALWEDPFKKPCYLFALVAGQLESRNDTFTTRSGRKVSLRI